MSERPIIFSAPMVRALLEGRKTQTRRIIKGVPMFTPEHDRRWYPNAIPPGGSLPDHWSWWEGPPHGQSLYHKARLAWAAGDRIWVKENWRTSVCADGTRASILETPGNGYCWPVWYEADGGAVTWRGSEGGGSGFVNPGKLRPSIFMPRWASRLTLLVTEVRVERLQDISEMDAVAEGIAPFGTAGAYLCPPGRDGLKQVSISAYDLFRDLWNSIHGADAWDASPWVAAISFEVHRANIDEIPTTPVAPNLAQGGETP